VGAHALGDRQHLLEMLLQLCRSLDHTDGERIGVTRRRGGLHLGRVLGESQLVQLTVGIGRIGKIRKAVLAHACGEHGHLREPRRGQRRDQLIDGFADKLEEWLEASHGKVRADVVHDKLAALGYTGSERTTRRAVAKKTYRAGRRRLYRPWVPEPGMWAQFDWCDGPVVAGVRTWLFCAWLAWSRFRVVLAVTDKAVPTLIACLDQYLHRFGGCPPTH
jgi:hypothetical protein